MGSGEFSSANWQHAAYIRKMRVRSSSWSDANSDMTATTNPDCYDSDIGFNASNSDWARYMYLGGPGEDDPDCN